ncbi:hypothetical protein Q5H93_18560 [Hymenobacter sp. ASUV-10]|uniref:Outer membrane protein beta-barrel domain-containing protein n=1 Tax=Hymenobacter aranciens TaxID=3063996 RepID=A0ABT9BER2_9BACT|nr:hypothetical protein [Hymenobacter sp. ASUV-10]MDO7876754.1 hypothetical protein [Hymenobacter sp. ASUV-10]
MLLRLLLLLFFSCITFGSLAQVYEPGWLVRSNGDTLRGEIENGFWREPPPFIHYRATAGSASQLFQPRQLRAVQFTGGRYFRYLALPVDHAAHTHLDRLERGLHYDVQTDSLLAEVLVEGHLSLLRVRLPSATHYFLLQPGHPVLELSERQYLRQLATGSWATADGNNYRGQLGTYFGTCPAAFAALQHTAFTADDLTAVVLTYNEQCTPARQAGRHWVAQASPRRRMALRGGVLAGGRYHHIPNLGVPAAVPCVDCGLHPFAGLYADLLQPGRVSAFTGEFSLQRFQSQGFQFFGPPTFQYRAWLGTARLGVRFLYPLPREQQVLFGFGYELAWVLAPVVTAGTATADELKSQEYAPPALLPHFVLGWRQQRLTISADAQLYNVEGGGDFSQRLFGTGYALRLATAYRLGRNPDAPKQPTSAAGGR